MELFSPPKTQEKIFIFIGDNLPVLIDYPDDVQVESPVTLMPLRETIGPSLRDDNTPKTRNQTPSNSKSIIYVWRSNSHRTDNKMK